MPHFSSQEQALGLEKPPTSLLTQWQFKMAKGAIAQAVSDNRVRARDQDIQMQIYQPNSPSGLMPTEHPHWKTSLEIAVLTTAKNPDGPLEAKNTTGEGETKGPNHLGFLHLPQTMVLRAIEVHCLWHLQCHPDWTIQTDQGIPDEVDGIEKKHAWK